MQSKLEQILEEKGLSPKYLAAITGCSVQTIYKIFHGHKPNINLRAQIARGLGVLMAEIWEPEIKEEVKSESQNNQSE